MNDIQARLDAFRSEVNFNLALGALSNMELPVPSLYGDCPVVVALDDEPLSILLSRLHGMGGTATMFFRGIRTVRMATVVDERCTTIKPDDDMSTTGEQPAPFATAGMFLDWIERCPNGVAISNTAGRPTHACDARRAELSPV